MKEAGASWGMQTGKQAVAVSETNTLRLILLVFLGREEGGRGSGGGPVS